MKRVVTYSGICGLREVMQLAHQAVRAVVAFQRPAGAKLSGDRKFRIEIIVTEMKIDPEDDVLGG